MNRIATFRFLLVLALLAGWGLPRGGHAQALAWQSALVVPTGSSQVQTTAADASGNVYVAGTFSGTASFGSLSLTSTGPQDVFVAQWNPVVQDFAWVKHGGGQGNAQGVALAAGPAGVYLAGNFTGTLAFDNLAVAATGTRQQGFVASFTPAGTFRWLRGTDGTGATLVTALAVSGSSLYVTGHFSGLNSLGSVPLVSSPGNSTEGFVAKLTEAGPNTAFTWAQVMGGSYDDRAQAVAVTGSAVYVAGVYSSPTIAFGTLSLPNNSLIYQQGFVTKLLDAGPTASFEWVQGLSSSDHVMVHALASSGTAVYVGGRFSGYATFGNQNLTPVASTNGFVARLTDTGSTGSLTWALALDATTYSIVLGLAAQGNRVYLAGAYGGSLKLGTHPLFKAPLSTLAACLLDVSPGSTYLWAIGTQVTTGSGFGNSLALSGTSVYVGGTATGTSYYGPFTLSVPTPTTSGFLASLSNAAALATTSPTTAPALTVYPNPASGAAHLTGAPAGTTGQVTDALGRAVATFTTDASGAALLPAGLAPGVYAVRVGAAVGRLVVQ